MDSRVKQSEKRIDQIFNDKQGLKASLLSLPSAKGYVQGPSALHGTVSGVLPHPLLKSVLEGAGTEQGSQDVTTPSTATYTPFYVGKPYAAQDKYSSGTPSKTEPAAISESHAVPFVQNRTAIYSNTIPIESMIRQPPSAFMTPVLTAVASAPGSFSSGTMAGRHRSKINQLICQEGVSESKRNEATVLRHIPLLLESFQDANMKVFTGREFLTWEAFIYQFERIAGR
ncbi:unnamed protein product [Mytilus coruscus]|uniref:Uncharacterized protein n=1 Tax=Mytilus coruscus TaxID=42192 RepID=A0A6J8ENP3_MYTCO|nr:unnamed protein product [Mytilus coruscus]